MKVNHYIGLLAIFLAIGIAALTIGGVANASNSAQVSIPADALVLERILDPVTGDVLSFSIVYQDQASGDYLYGEGSGTTVTSERSATAEEVQRYVAHLSVTNPPQGETSYLTWAENRIAALDVCLVFAQDYQVMSQSERLDAQDELGECLELSALTEKQMIKGLVDMLVVNGVFEP